jgi:hypothetical protein
MKPLTPEQKKRRADTGREWRKKNPDKVAEHARRSRIKNKDKIRARQRKWLEENKESHQTKAREWYRQNKDRVRDLQLQREFGISLEKGRNGFRTVAMFLVLMLRCMMSSAT